MSQPHLTPEGERLLRALEGIHQELAALRHELRARRVPARRPGTTYATGAGFAGQAPPPPRPMTIPEVFDRIEELVAHVFGRG